MAIVVMVDGGASVSKALLKKYNIVYLPCNLKFSNGKEYKDFLEIKSKNLKLMIDDYNEVPIIEFLKKREIENCFRKYIEAGDDILFLSMSSHLSNNYQVAQEAAKSFDSSLIQIVDSLNVGVGQTLLAILAKEYIDQGYGLKQVTKYIEKIIPYIKNYCLVSKTNYLSRQTKCKEISNSLIKFYHSIPLLELNKGDIRLVFNGKENSDLSLQVLKNIITDNSYFMNNNHMLISYLGQREKVSKLRTFSNKQINNLNLEVVENNSLTYLYTGEESLVVAFMVDKSRLH